MKSVITQEDDSQSSDASADGPVATEDVQRLSGWFALIARSNRALSSGPHSAKSLLFLTQQRRGYAQQMH